MTLFPSAEPVALDLLSEVTSEATPRTEQRSKREQILQGAMQVFLERGYAGTSMDRVAAVAQVSKQTVYSHFKDKKGLFTALIEQMTIQRFQIRFGTDFFGEPPDLLLRQLAELMLEKLDDPQFLAFFRLIIAESARFPELAKLYIQTVIQFGHSRLGQYFAQHSELQISDPDATVRVFFGSIAAFILAQGVLHGQEVMPIAKERLVNTLVDLIVSQTDSRAHKG